jgi:signal peptidase I
MKIVIKDNNRVLEQDDTNDLIINDGDIIMYLGIYHKKIFDIVDDIIEIQTRFIGQIYTYRADTDGITGIYIVPLYIWNNINSEWHKIVDYQVPTTNYFLYPHLLMLPGKDYHYKPIYTLHTCENCDLDNYKDITKTFCLHNS